MRLRARPSSAPPRFAGANVVPVVYIAGLHRSGTTLLGLLLGRAIDGEFVGEVEILWQRGVIEDRRCGCGAPFSGCPFWTRVGEEAFGGWSVDQARTMVSLKARLARRRHVMRLLRDARVEGDDEYAATIARLYRAAHHVAGKPLIDSSKTPTHAARLAAIAGLEVRVAHIVRDSRGVAFSKTKAKELLDKPGAMHERFRPSRTGVDWLRDNLLIEQVRRATPFGTLVRYEDLAADPRGVIATLARNLDLAPSVDVADVADGVTHSVAGNPMRFSEGARPVRVDDGWRTQMSPRDRLAVGALTLPLLVRYGFVRLR